jgi:hypothetical protein
MRLMKISALGTVRYCIRKRPNEIIALREYGERHKFTDILANIQPKLKKN